MNKATTAASKSARSFYHETLLSCAAAEGNVEVEFQGRKDSEPKPKPFENVRTLYLQSECSVFNLFCYRSSPLSDQSGKVGSERCWLKNVRMPANGRSLILGGVSAVVSDDSKEFHLRRHLFWS
jgi:hypothetical protein